MAARVSINGVQTVIARTGRTYAIKGAGAIGIVDGIIAGKCLYFDPADLIRQPTGRGLLAEPGANVHVGNTEPEHPRAGAAL
jgi:hypothetical protein